MNPNPDALLARNYRVSFNKFPTSTAVGEKNGVPVNLVDCKDAFKPVSRSDFHEIRSSRIMHEPVNHAVIFLKHRRMENPHSPCLLKKLIAETISSGISAENSIRLPVAGCANPRLFA